MTTTSSMQSAAPVGQAKPAPSSGIEYELLLDCVHCGLCTSACPTYVELGTEMDSPRGRIYLMRAVTDGRIDARDTDVRRHLDLCLDCRACESACPSGVQYGKLIEPFRAHMAQTGLASTRLSWLRRLALFHLTPSAWRMRLALAPARFMQKLGLDRALERMGVHKLMPAALREMVDLLPRLTPHHGKLPELLPAEGKCRARVALFTGCAADAFFPETTVATARVLQHNGCDVWIPRQQKCCGALHYHAALPAAAKEYAADNCRAFAASPPGWKGSIDAIIVSAAGCGAMLKEYGHLLHESEFSGEAEKFRGKVRDISEFLMELGPLPPRHPIPVRAVYHDACHLCHAQQIRKQPRELLGLIPGLELVPLAESEICCGAAGSYSLTEPEMAERLGLRKVKNILDANVRAVFSGNVGCQLQIGRYLRKERPDVWLAHTIDALWASYSGQVPKGLGIPS